MATWVKIIYTFFLAIESLESEHTKSNTISTLFLHNGAPTYPYRMLFFKEKVKAIHTSNKYWSSMMQMQSNPRLNSIYVTQLFHQLFSSFIQCFWKNSYPDELYDVAAPLLKCQQCVLRKMFTEALLAGHGSRELDWACIQGRAYTENAAVGLSCEPDTAFGTH